MPKNKDKDQDFEYNDGLGDLLREKEKRDSQEGGRFLKPEVILKI